MLEDPFGQIARRRGIEYEWNILARTNLGQVFNRQDAQQPLPGLRPSLPDESGNRSPARSRLRAVFSPSPKRDQSGYQLGTAAARIFLDRIQRDTGPAKHIVLDTTLKIGILSRRPHRWLEFTSEPMQRKARYEHLGCAPCFTNLHFECVAAGFAHPSKSYSI